MYILYILHAVHVDKRACSIAECMREQEDLCGLKPVSYRAQHFLLFLMNKILRSKTFVLLCVKLCAVK